MIPWLFVILLCTGLVIHLVLGLYSRRFKAQPVQLPFEVLMYICAIWCATFIFDISTDSLGLKIILMQVRHIGVSFITLTLLVIAIFFTGHGSWLTKRRLALLLVIPVTNVALALATQYSTLFRYNYTLVETAGGFSVLGFTNGIWSSAVYLPFNYIMEVATFILLLQVIFGGQKLYARQALLIFAAIVIPVIVDVLFTLGISPVQGYNMVPSTFAFTGILLAIALFEFRFIDIVPIARTMLFEQMADPMLVLDPEGRLADFNPAAEQVLGVNRMKDIGKASSISLKKHEALLECIGQLHHAPCTIMIGGVVGTRLFEVSIQEMRSGGGMPPAKLVIMRDVTDRTRAEEQAVHLASFPELTPVLTLEADPNGSILYANPSCMSSLQEMGETDPRMFIPQDLRDRLDGTVIAESLHEVREIELHGRLFRENVYFTPQFSSIRIYASDITGRKRAEEALKESQSRFRAVIDSTPFPVAVVDPEDTTVEFWSQSAVNLFGHTPATTAEWYQLAYPDPEYRNNVIEQWKPALERARLSGLAVNTGEYRVTCRDGSVRICELYAAFLAGRLIVTFNDITERKRAEAALRESEEKYREFFTTSRDSVFITTPMGQWVDFNDTALEMFGYGSREELMALPLPDLYLHPGQRGDLLTRIEREGYVKEFAVQLIKKDGSVIDTLITAVPLQNPDGSIKAFVGSIRDITDQKRAEDALRESERKFRETVKTLDEGYYSCTLDGMLLEHNVAFNRILGIDADLDLKGTQLPDFWQNPDDRTPYVEELLAKGFIQNFSINAKTVQGTNIVVLANSHLVKDENARIVRIDGTFTDFTERKRAEEELRESEEKFATAFKTSPYAITITRATDGHFIDVNDGFTQITGYTHEETVTNSSIGLDLWVNREDRKQVLFDLTGGRNVVGREFLFRRKDGVIITGLFSARIILLNKEPCILSSISDITERKQAEEALREGELRFRTMAEWTYDWEYWTGTDSEIIYISPSVESMTGYTRGEFTADPGLLIRIVHPDDRTRVEEHISLHAEAKQTDLSSEIEFRIIHRDGSQRWIGHTCRAIFNAGGNWAGRRISNRDITDRKRSEEQLLLKNNVFESSIAANSIADIRGIITHVNPAFLTLWGYRTAEDAIGQSVSSFFAREEDGPPVLEALDTTGRWEGEFLAKRTDGSTFVSQGISTVIRDGKGGPIGYQSTNLDITDRKHAEEALRETNEYLNNLINYANAPIITWDPEFRITRFNHAFEHLSGRLQEEVLGKNLAILFPLENKETLLSLINKTLEGERWETVEIPILNADGSTRSVLWNSANVLGRDGNVIATIAQGVDITDQKQALDRIRWLAGFPELNPNPVIEMDAKGKITFANAITSTTLLDLGLPDDPALFIPPDREEILRLLRETDELQLYREVSLGNEMFAENISLNQALQVVRIYTLNITREKRAEREREHMFADLEQKNAELERFAYTASHDLKTPLITIRGFLGFVERDAEAGDMVRMRQDLVRISNATVKMQELLDSLLELSRIGRIVGPPEPVSMRLLSEEAVELLAVPIQERGVTLKIAPDLPEVYGDKKRLREVMVNLIENGVKFMGDQPDPLVEIGVRYDAEKPVFFVRDNGIGILPEYHGRLFSLFERLEVSVPGTGVGLALVKRIIEIHGGKIWVESEGAGKGTTFWFTLPGVPKDRDNNQVEQE